MYFEGNLFSWMSLNLATVLFLVDFLVFAIEILKLRKISSDHCCFSVVVVVVKLA